MRYDCCMTHAGFPSSRASQRRFTPNRRSLMIGTPLWVAPPSHCDYPYIVTLEPKLEPS
jgi:hypothetical protein